MAKIMHEKVTLTVTCKAFRAGERIPTKHTEDGDDLSPKLEWTGAPEGVKEFALIVDDPDAPRPQPWVHWVIYNIPPDTKALPEGVARDERPKTPAGAAQGRNTWGTIGYRGPAPPKGHGTHHYHFRLYALDAPLELKPGADKEALVRAIEGHIIAQGELIGTYSR